MPDLYLNVGHLIPVGYSDLSANDQNPKFRKGGVSFIQDVFGFRVFQYMHNKDGAASAVGDLQSRAANTTITNATSGTTTSVQKDSAGWTASAFKDRLVYVQDNDDAAGAVPEGEVGIIVENDTDTLWIDSARPFTAAVAANDDLAIYSLFDWDDAADGDLAINVFGVAMAAVSDNYWGWLQRHGYCPDVKLKAATGFTAGDPIVADAAAVGSFGTDGQELWIGFAPVTVTSDIVADKAPMHLSVFFPPLTGTAP